MKFTLIRAARLWVSVPNDETVRGANAIEAS